MEKIYALNLIEKTKEDYNKIAPHFSSTRTFLWKDLIGIEETVQKGNKVLDIGCGNGRLFQALKDKNINYYGIDISENLIEIAKEKHPGGNFAVGNLLELPFENETFDVCYMIASLHHIPSKEFRLKALAEAKRVLKLKGILFLTVWNLWQSKYLRFVFEGLLNTKLNFGDAFVPWKKGFEIERYVHAFRKNELVKLLQEAGFCNIEVQKTKGNYVVLAQRG